MNLWYSFIITCVGVAEGTSVYDAFGDDRDILHDEVKAYCNVPGGGYTNSKYGPIEDWDVSAVTSMEKLFHSTGSSSCNPDISGWNVSSVENFSNMFNGAVAFNADLREWDVSKGKEFYGMFYQAAAFNGDISRWDVSKGAYFSDMFKEAAAFNGDISRWNVSESTYFSGMFYGAVAFNKDLSRWDVGKGIYFENMFSGSGMNFYIGGWNLTSAFEINQGRVYVFRMMVAILYHSGDHIELHTNWPQVSNLMTTVDTETRISKICSALADLIVLATENGIERKEMSMLDRWIERIKQLMVKMNNK